MKTINYNSIKNTRVRVKDIKAGKVIYIAHPEYGIVKKVVTSKPYMNRNIGLFAKCVTQYDNFSVVTHFSLRDAGITEGDSYNGRRAFFKRKHAVAWAEKWAKDKSFIEQHARHEQQNEEDEWLLGGDWGWSGE